MGLFKFGKKRDVLDLSERYKKQKEKEEQESSETKSSEQEASPFTFFDTQQSTSQSKEVIDVSEAPHEKKRKLAKRILEMTNKLEDVNNQIYHLQQRIEVLERKIGVSKY